MIKDKQIPAKMCFSHIGGKLGMLIMETFIEKGWIEKQAANDRHFFVTDKGKIGLRKIGVDVSQITPERMENN